MPGRVVKRSGKAAHGRPAHNRGASASSSSLLSTGRTRGRTRSETGAQSCLHGDHSPLFIFADVVCFATGSKKKKEGVYKKYSKEQLDAAVEALWKLTAPVRALTNV